MSVTDSDGNSVGGLSDSGNGIGGNDGGFSAISGGFSLSSFSDTGKSGPTDSAGDRISDGAGGLVSSYGYSSGLNSPPSSITGLAAQAQMDSEGPAYSDGYSNGYGTALGQQAAMLSQQTAEFGPAAELSTLDALDNTDFSNTSNEDAISDLGVNQIGQFDQHGVVDTRSEATKNIHSFMSSPLIAMALGLVAPSTVGLIATGTKIATTPDTSVAAGKFAGQKTGGLIGRMIGEGAGSMGSFAGHIVGSALGGKAGVNIADGTFDAPSFAQDAVGRSLGGDGSVDWIGHYKRANKAHEAVTRHVRHSVTPSYEKGLVSNYLYTT